MDPRIGFATGADFRYEEAIPRAAEFDCDFLELLMDGRYERRRLADDADDVRALAADHGVDVVVHLPFRLDLGSPFEHVREGAVRELTAAVEAAAAAGAEKGVVHAASFAWEAAWDPADVQPLLFDALRRVDAAGREHGVEVCAENLKGGYCPLPAFADLFAETDASMCLDTGHAYVEGHDEADVAAFVREHADRISHVHLNDTRRRDTDEHLPFGSGLFDFEPVFEAFPDDWAGTLSLEVFTTNYEYVETSVERLRALLD